VEADKEMIGHDVPRELNETTGLDHIPVAQ
jgi:hypothetical protein